MSACARPAPPPGKRACCAAARRRPPPGPAAAPQPTTPATARSLRNAVRKLIKGEKPVKVGVVGGSITFLENDVTARGWWAKLARFLTLGFPHTKVLAKNGAVPGTPSGYALMCLELMVEPDVDIVFIGAPRRWARGALGAARGALGCDRAARAEPRVQCVPKKHTLPMAHTSPPAARPPPAQSTF